MGMPEFLELAKLMNVTASSVSKMAKRLDERNLILFERYGIITMTEMGIAKGKKLAEKHDILVQVYRMFGIEDEYVEQEVKNIGIFISDYVVKKMEHFLRSQ